MCLDPSFPVVATSTSASAFHGLRRRELDLGGLFIRLLESVGLAWQVVRVSPEHRQARRAAGQVAADRPRSSARARPVLHHSQIGAT
jgi:hypothetical protein